MKKSILVLVVILSFYKGFSQNYYKEYPISSTITFNGTQQRMELSVYDSLLQTTVTYNSPWTNYTIFVHNLNGKIDFTTWVNPNLQNGDHGFIVYDYLIHQFAVKWFNDGIAANEDIITGNGIKWFARIIQFETSPNFYQHSAYYYRYNLQLHKWDGAGYADHDLDGNQVTGPLNLQFVSDLFGHIEYNDKGYFYYYDSFTGDLNFFGSGCAGWGTYISDDYVAMDTGCSDNYMSLTFDAENHGFSSFGRAQLLSNQTRGIFHAIDQDSTSKNFFYTYDQAIHQWLADSINSVNINNIVTKDRVVAYIDQTIGFNKKVFYMVHNPILHVWVKDSTAVNGTATGLTIDHGTVKWTDGNGLNIRGYDINSGWGNYTTPLFLYFHLTNFSSQGQSLIHARNYSIGTDNIYFDFGDGVTSTNNQHVVWHYYKDSSSNNICIYDSSGTQSSCQQVIFNNCSQSGIASASNDTICYGDSLTLTVTANIGSIQWQKQVSGAWVDESAAGSNSNSYTMVPLQNQNYRAKIINGTCIPAYSNILSNVVMPMAYKGVVSDTLFELCQGGIVKMRVDSSVGEKQWQKNTGTGWNNIVNANTILYTDTVSVSTQYRVILTSGLCTTDTTDIIVATVTPKPPMPVTIGATQCGPGFATLTASGTGTLNWHKGILFSTPRVYSGSSYTTYIDSTQSFYVHSISGTNQIGGYVDNSFGNVGTVNSIGKGLRIISATPATLDRITFYPQQTGTARFSLYNSNTNQLESYMEVTIQTAAVPTEVYLGLDLQGGEQYNLLLTDHNFNIKVNTSNAAYPLTLPGSDITVLGYINNGFYTDSSFYSFYNIKFSTGCKSLPKIVTATYYPEIISNITATGPLSFCQGSNVKLNAAPLGGYFYTWMKNGIAIPGAVNTTYTASTAGNYSVKVNNLNCADTSNILPVRVPCSTPIDPSEKTTPGDVNTSQLFVYYDAGSGNVNLNLWSVGNEKYKISIVDPSGREIVSENKEFTIGKNQLAINVQHFSTGMYIIRAQSENNNFVKRFVKN